MSDGQPGTLTVDDIDRLVSRSIYTSLFGHDISDDEDEHIMFSTPSPAWERTLPPCSYPLYDEVSENDSEVAHEDDEDARVDDPGASSQTEASCDDTGACP